MKFKLNHILLFQFIAILLLAVSCGRDDESLQRIDQILNIYMKSSTNPDLLNAKKSGSYTSYSVNDMLGDKDNSPVSIPLKMRQDSIYYMDYLAGAKRKKLDSSGTTYYSRMQVTLNQVINNTTQAVAVDMLEIHYRNTPEAFQVSQVLYNSVPVFSKDAGTPNSINNVTVTK